MQITDKTKLLRALVSATTKEIILEFDKCYLNVYCLGNTYLTKTETIQVATENKFTGYLVLDKTNELINVIKDCCSKKSSEIEFKIDLNNKGYLYYKRTNKEQEVVLDIEVVNKPEVLVKALETINEEFNNECYLTYEQYSNKIKTKYEYEAVEINNILISNKDLELVPKVFDIEFNKQLVFKDYVDTTNLKKKDLEALKTNPLCYDITYEDLILSNSDNLIQITNTEENIYFYCFRVFKLNETN